MDTRTRFKEISLLPIHPRLQFAEFVLGVFLAKNPTIKYGAAHTFNRKWITRGGIIDPFFLIFTSRPDD